MCLPTSFLNFNVTGLLGSGTYGDVVSAVDTVTGMDVAIKLPKKGAEGPRCLEAAIQSVLDHENICKLYECVDAPRGCVLVLELVRGVDLHKYLRRSGRLDEARARMLFVQVAHAVDYLHTHSIVHRDLKLENIMVAGGVAKICDFGLATFYDRTSVLRDYCGTPRCAPPEIMNGVPYIGPEVDVWCLGVILYAMVHGALPFEDGDTRLPSRRAIVSKVRVDGSLTSALKDLLARTLEPDKSTRIGMDQLLMHPWMGTAKHTRKRALAFVDKGVVDGVVAMGFAREDVLRNIPDTCSKEHSAYCLVRRKLQSGHRLLVPGAQPRPCNVVGLDFMADRQSLYDHRKRAEKHEVLRGMSPARQSCWIPFLPGWRRAYSVRRDMALGLKQAEALVEYVLATFPKATFRASGSKPKYVVSHANGLEICIELSCKAPFTACSFKLAGGSKAEFADFVVEFIRAADAGDEHEAAG